MLDFEKQFDNPRAVKRLSTAPDTDPETGFLPLLAAAIPMVANLAGSLLSHKSSKHGGPPPEAAQANNVLDMLKQAIGGDSAHGEVSIKEVVENLIRTIPSPVINQVKAGIRELRDAEKAAVQNRTTLVNAVDSRFGPQIHALLAAVKAADLQRRATYEHDRLKSKAAFRTNTTNNLKTIAQRLTAIENRLNGYAIVRGKERIALLGGRNILER